MFLFLIDERLRAARLRRRRQHEARRPDNLFVPYPVATVQHTIGSVHTLALWMTVAYRLSQLSLL